MQSIIVIFGECGEGSLGFPGHIGIGVTRMVFQDLNHPPTGHIEVLTWVATMRPTVADEGACKGGVDALCDEDVQQLVQIGSLLLLVADVVSVEPDRSDSIV